MLITIVSLHPVARSLVSQSFQKLIGCSLIISIYIYRSNHVGVNWDTYRFGEMGSLMAGWDSPVLGDDNKVRLMRNQSLTKDEVAAFWRQHQRKPDNGETTEKSPSGSSQRRRSPTTSSPLARGDKINDAGAGAGESSPSKSRDWWTRSNSAFLNEPPQEVAKPGTAQSYTPQFHVVAGNA